MKILKLHSNGLGRYDDVSPFMVTDNKLELKVELPNYNGEFYLITENNGKTEKRLLPREGTVTFERLTEGELNAAVKHYLKGALIREYKVEPLLLKNVDGNLTVLPELAALNAHVERLEQEYAAVLRDLTEYKIATGALIQDLEENVCALIRFAYKDYSNNPFLGGGALNNFLKEFGFTLNEKEIKTIKGEKENDED